MSSTNEQFDAVTAKCRSVFATKLQEYGASWRVYRPETVTDMLLNKAKRIRSLETKGETWVGEGIQPEYEALVNYGAIALIQAAEGCSDSPDMSAEKALELYDRRIAEARHLMLDKNHDYDEAWRGMRTTSYTDFILVKLNRIKEIEDNGGRTLGSEGIASNILDIMNYAIFGLIRFEFKD